MSLVNKITIKISFIILFILFIFIYFLISLSIEDEENKFLDSFLNSHQKSLIIKYFYPYKFISQQDEIIIKEKEKFLKLELDYIKSGSDIGLTKSQIELSNKMILNKYKFNSGFYYSIGGNFLGTGYIDFYEKNIFVLSSRGVLSFKNISSEEENFQLINNNILDFINYDQIKKSRKFSLKDLTIINNKMFISFTEEIEKDCWNTSIIYGNVDYEYITFEKIFSPKECIHSINNIDKEFHPAQSGGRIIKFDKDHILLTIGDYRSRYLAQNKDSVNGKIIKINLNNNKYKIISMGHRNPQGLYFDTEKNIILATEHGPQGGDEINLLDVDKINKGEIQNYGWAISSAGEHYGGKNTKNKNKYKKYPLYNSHADYGFIEPLKSFVPSIAISEIVKISKNKYAVGSMRDNALFFFQLNDENKIININKVKVFERIRDLKFFDDNLYLFLEESASIGIIKIN